MSFRAPFLITTFVSCLAIVACNTTPPAPAPTPAAVSSPVETSTTIVTPSTPFQGTQPVIINISGEPALSWLKPTLVSVNFDNLSPTQAAANLSQSLGTPVRLITDQFSSSGLTLNMSMHLHDVPYYHALLQFARATQSYPTTSTGNARTFYATVGSSVGRANVIGDWSIAGPFAFEIGQITAVRTGTNQQDIMRLRIFAEDKVKILSYPKTLDIEQFVDDKNVILKMEPTAGVQSQPDEHNATFSFPMTPSRAARIATLKGTFAAVVCQHDQTLRSDPSQEMTTDIEGMLVDTFPVKTNAAQETVLTIRYHRGTLPQKQWDELAGNLQYLQPTTTFKRVQGGALSTQKAHAPTVVKESADATLVTFTYSRMAGVVVNHVSYQLATDLRLVHIPFLFHDLPLPAPPDGGLVVKGPQILQPTAAGEPVITEPVVNPPLAAMPFGGLHGTILDFPTDPDLAYLKATPVSVHFNNLTATDAATYLSDALGHHVVINATQYVQARLNPRFAMNLQNVPMLYALLQFELAAQAYMTTFNDTTISLYATIPTSPGRNRAVGAWSIAGAFSVEIDDISKARNDETTVSFRILTENTGRFHIVRPPTTVDVEQCADELGMPRTLGRPAATVITIGNGTLLNPPNSQEPVSLTVPISRGQGGKIAVLRGSFSFILAESTEILSVKNSELLSSYRIDGMPIEILPTSVDGTQTSIPVRYHRGNTTPDKWKELAPILRYFPLTATAQPSPASVRPPSSVQVGFSSQKDEGDSVLVTYKVGTTQPLQNIRLEVASKMREVHVPFEFKDIPLP